MHAIRARHAYDGESFLSAGATVLVEDGLIIGVESYGFEVPGDCLVTSHEGTLLPGLIDAHAHLVADSGASALDRVAGYSAEEIDLVVRRDGGLRYIDVWDSEAHWRRFHDERIGPAVLKVMTAHGMPRPPLRRMSRWKSSTCG
jgi:hypothetical protein